MPDPGRLPTPCFLIAEAGVNHDGDLGRARELVEVAAACGADAVKFQSFHADRLAAPDAPKPGYQRERTDASESQRDLLRRLELGPEAHAELFELARRRGIEFLSTPYDEACVALLRDLGVTRLKIASGELTNVPLLRAIGAARRPTILSTGMATLDEVQAACATLRDAGAPELVLLHCTSSYPTRPEECNLAAMETLRRATGLPVGYSDHTPGIEIACAAVALGAVALEKHFTLDRALPGPDHHASLEPAELERLVAAVRSVTRALGSGEKRPMPSELEARALARRGLVARRELPAGCVLDAADLHARRPARGIPPSELDRVVGRTLRAPLAAGDPLRWEHLG